MDLTQNLAQIIHDDADDIYYCASLGKSCGTAVVSRLEYCDNAIALVTELVNGVLDHISCFLVF